MPPAAAKHCTLILYDVNCKTKDALAMLVKISYLRNLAPSKDQAKVFLFNTAETDNDRGYENVSLLTNFTPTGVLEAVENATPINGNWLGSLQLGIDCLKEKFGEAGVVTLQLVLISDLSTPTEFIEKNSKKIIEQLNDYEIFFYIVGPDVKPPFYVMSKNDIQTWKESITIDKTNENLCIAKNIVESTKHSVICNYKIGLNLIFSYKNSKGTQPWLVPLSIGTKLELPASTVRVLKEEAPFKLQDVEKVLASTRWVTDDEENIEVDFSDIINGVTRHGKFVPIDSEERFKTDGPRSFSLLGFTQSTNIPEYLIQSDATYYTLPDFNQSEQSVELFSRLVDELAAANKYAIVRRVYNKNNVPKFMVLIPKPEETPKCFVTVELPYADDIKHDYIEKPIEDAMKIEENDEVFAFLDNIDVHSETCKVDVPLAPSMMYDPNCLNIVNKLEEKYLRKDLQLSKVDLNYLKEEENVPVESLKIIWPAREVIKPKEVAEEINDDYDDNEEFNYFS